MPLIEITQPLLLNHLLYHLQVLLHEEIRMMNMIHTTTATHRKPLHFHLLHHQGRPAPHLFLLVHHLQLHLHYLHLHLPQHHDQLNLQPLKPCKSRPLDLC